MGERIKLIVCGVGGVGKSAITNRFVVGRWVAKYDPTIEESYQTIVDIDGKAYGVEILDTAGQDAYAPLRETFMHTGDGFMLVYSITDDQTLEELRAIREQILRVHRDRKVPMILVGNKVDLADERAVSKEEGSQLANEFGSDFVEVTAKEDYKVKDAFHDLIRTILNKNPNAGTDAGANGGMFGGGVDQSGDIDVQIVSKGKTGKSKKGNALSKTRSDSKTKKEKDGSGKGGGKKGGDEKDKSKCLIL